MVITDACLSGSIVVAERAASPFALKRRRSPARGLSTSMNKENASTQVRTTPLITDPAWNGDPK
jgi:hypothetical protein